MLSKKHLFLILICRSEKFTFSFPNKTDFSFSLCCTSNECSDSTMLQISQLAVEGVWGSCVCMRCVLLLVYTCAH